MTKLRASEQEAIRNAIAANALPKASGRGRTTYLQVSQTQRKTIMNSSGGLTPAGEYYYSLTGEEPPAFGFDPNQRIIQQGPRDYIKMHDGKRALVRTLKNPSTGAYKLTKVGAQFFKNKYAQYDVTIPIWVGVEDKKKGGTKWIKNTTMSANAIEGMKLSVPAELPDAQRFDELQKQVMARLSELAEKQKVDPTSDRILVHVESEEQWFYDPKTASSMTFTEHDMVAPGPPSDKSPFIEETNTSSAPTRPAASDVQVKDLLNRRLRGRVLAYEHFFEPGHISAHAYTNTLENCAFSQLCTVPDRHNRKTLWTSAQLTKELDEAWSELYSVSEPGEFDVVEGKVCHWSLPDQGVTAAMILRVCQKRKVPCYILHGETLIKVFRPDESYHGTSIVFSFWSDHIYMYDGLYAKTEIMRSKNEIVELTPRPLQRIKHHRERPDKTPPFKDWLEWFGFERAAAGHYRVLQDEMDQVRLDFLKDRRSPKVFLTSPTKIKRLSYSFTKADEKGRGSIVIHAIPAKHESILSFTQHFKVITGRYLEYKGVGVASATFKAICSVTFERASLNQHDRADILKAQENRCDACEEPLESGDIEFDHRLPLFQGGTNRVENMRALCHECHLKKTKEETLQSCALASHFDPVSMQLFVKSPKPRPAYLHVQNMNRPGLLADVIKCHTNIYYDNIYPIPCYCPLDSIVAAESGRLYDYMWIDKGPIEWTSANYLRHLPYQGPRWYHRQAVEFMLSHGASWNDVKYGFEASAHLKPNFLRRPIDVVREAWERVGDKELPWKRPLNAAWGVMSIDESWVLSSITTDCEDDALACFGYHVAKKHVTSLESGASLCDYIFKQELVSNVSFRPVHQMCLDGALTRLAQARYIALQLGTLPNEICALRGDAIYFTPARKRIDKIKDRFNAIEQVELSELGLGEIPANQTRLKFSPNCMTRGGSDSIVYKCESCAEGPPATSLPKDPPVLEHTTIQLPGVWNDIVESLEGPDAIFEIAREVVVDKGKSVLVQGLPGTGKTTLVLGLEVELKKCEEARTIHKMSLTHVASKVLEGMTIHHYVSKYVRTGLFTKGVVIIDEVGQIGVHLLAELVSVFLSDQIQCIVMGDENQFDAIDNIWRGCAVKRRVWDSSLLKSMCGCTRLTLNRYRRGDDPSLFAFYSQINQGMKELSLEEVIVNFKREFPKKPGHATYNLVISHSRREALNKELNALAYEEYHQANPDGPAMWVEVDSALSGKNKPQDFMMFPGQVLIGCTVDTKDGIYNGGFYRVLHFNDDGAMLEDIELSDQVWASCKVLKRYMRLSHACVYAQIQGKTLRNALVRLWDTEHTHFTRRHLMVGVSRATSGKYVDIA